VNGGLDGPPFACVETLPVNPVRLFGVSTSTSGAPIPRLSFGGSAADTALRRTTGAWLVELPRRDSV